MADPPESASPQASAPAPEASEPDPEPPVPEAVAGVPESPAAARLPAPPRPQGPRRPPIDVPPAAQHGFRLIAAGDHRAAAEEAERLLASDSPLDQLGGQMLQSTVRPEPGAVAVAVGSMLGAVLLLWVALLPHGAVATARGLLDDLVSGSVDAAHARFTDSGWTDGGERFVRTFSGRSGQSYDRREAEGIPEYVMVDFSSQERPGERVRRYLIFSSEDGRIEGVRRSRPRPAQQ